MKTYEEAITECEKCSETKFGRLIANREIPILEQIKVILKK